MQNKDFLGCDPGFVGHLSTGEDVFESLRVDVVLLFYWHQLRGGPCNWIGLFIC